MKDIEFSAAEGARRFERGQFAIADILCRGALAKNPQDADAWSVLARIAAAVGEADAAQRYAAEALRLNPVAPVNLEPAARLAPSAPVPRADQERLLLIKAWGNGFCSDLDHTLGHLLLAEITGRTPVIHWGANSLFGRTPEEDAFREFFEPVSPLGIRDLIGKGHDFFPPKWNDASLLEENKSKLEGDWSRLPGIAFFNRPERVVVADYHVGVATLVPWIRPGHPLHGAGVEAATRWLTSKYLKLRPEIQRDIDTFADARFTTRPVIAVHIRGSDKEKEDHQLAQKIAVVPQAVQQFAARSWNYSVFLLTDSEPVRRRFQQTYPANLITTECTRTDTQVGLHYQGFPDRVRLGVEVVRDAWLAARCDFFVGNGSSNVSCLVHHLKEWPKGASLLLGPAMTSFANPYLYLSREEAKEFA